MSMQATKLYMRFDEAVKKLYLTQIEDEEKFKDKKEERAILDRRTYGTYEELMKREGSDMPKTTRAFKIIQEWSPPFMEKWVPFKQDRVLGYKKGEWVLTQEMLELIGSSGQVVLKETTNREKDRLYKMVACQVLRAMNDQEKMKNS